MTRLNSRKSLLAIFFFCTVAAIASSAQTFTTLANLTKDNQCPMGTLVEGVNGNFYGLTQNNAVYLNGGSIFVMTAAGSVTTLRSLSLYDGGIASELVLNPDGTFYGTACCALYEEWGTAFNISARGTFKVLSRFDKATGQPDAALRAASGSYYGTTLNGGPNHAGIVFRMDRTGALTTLYTFCTQSHCPDLGVPLTLIQATDGNFYGTGVGNNPVDEGVIFRITPGGSLTTLYTFCTQTGCPDGSWPTSLMQGSDGDFYGTTQFGGLYYGTIFKITSSGILTTLHVFCTETNCPDGSSPVAMIQATDGNFYGTTNGGFGSIFRMTPSGQLTTLHTFDMTGEFPGPLMQGTDGNFYGMTSYGGANQDGTVYKLSMGLGPFVKLVQPAGRIGETGGIIGQGLTGTTDVSINGLHASFTVVSDTYIRAIVPAGATSGFVTVQTPSGILKSNVPFYVIQ